MFTLFEKSNIHLKNRFVRSATNENSYYPEKNWQRQAKLYEELAKGGVGAIITGGFVVSSTSSESKIVNLKNPETAEGLELLTESAHRYGAKIWMQILHAGRQDPYASEAEPAWCPSEYTGEIYRLKPKVMTTEDIQSVVEDFGRAALLARERGFDGVEVLAGHGYLLSQFLSPAINHREDAYGGSTTKRFRIVGEIARAIREKTGPDFTLGIKLNCHDLCEEGIDRQEFLALGELCEGLFDFVEVSAGMNEHWKNFLKYFKLGPSLYREEARKLRKVYSGVIILSGNNIDIQMNQEMLQGKEVDLIGLSRALIREPGLINHWVQGKGKTPECERCNLCNINKFLGPLHCWKKDGVGVSE